MSAIARLRPARRSDRAVVSAWRAAVILAALLAWEGAVRAGWADVRFTSSPTRILTAAFALPANPDLRFAFILTGWELGMAVLLAVAAGLTLGVSIGLSETGRRTAMPILGIFFSVPQLVFLPLYVLFFGVGPASKVAFGFTHALLPIVMNTITGAGSVNPDLVAAARAMGARRWQVLRRAVLPAAMPAIITGLRLGVSQAVLAVLVAELMASRAGLGYWVRSFGASLKVDEMFATTLMISALAVALNEALRWIEVRVSAWKGEPS